MNLTKKEYKQFLRIHPRLMYYVAEKELLMPKGISFTEYMDLDVAEKVPSRDRIYERPEYMDEFIQENPYGFSKDDLDIVKGFKAFKRGQFWVVKFLKNYTIFLDEDYAYGVLALGDPFYSFWGDNLPVMVNTVLLPFKGKLVYDGIMMGRNIFFGKGIRSSVKLKYDEAKTKYGIITSLPIPRKPGREQFTSEDQLKLYMKTANSRAQYEYEIEDLLDKYPSLYSLYVHLWGKINARAKKKRLKELGLTGHYFAIYLDTIITSSTSRSKLKQELKNMLKGDDVDAVYVFKV